MLDKDPGSWLDLPELRQLFPPELAGEREKKDAKKVFSNPNFFEKFSILERMIVQNNNHEKQAIYKGVVTPNNAIAQSDVVGPSISLLWTFNCKLTTGRSVSCMTWNEVNSDILAVGYNELNPDRTRKAGVAGLVLCWSAQNIRYPERIFYAPAPVTAISFSRAHPTLIAVGCGDGSLHVYNLRDFSSTGKLTPIFHSGQTEFKHLAPIWEIKWLDRGNERGEGLVTISEDGKIVEWSIKKGSETIGMTYIYIYIIVGRI
jgi:WD40 repeat protein